MKTVRPLRNFTCPPGSGFLKRSILLPVDAAWDCLRVFFFGGSRINPRRWDLRIWHLVRQFPHDAPLPTDLARRRLCRWRSKVKFFWAAVTLTG